MLSHSDRRLTLRWAKIGPLLVRATSPVCATLLAEKLPYAIPAMQPEVIPL